ncbi:hypothetical protein B0H16DRAFT_1455475 [Mycena metata]|uniref:Uncharacterized protein n=1 Tax=Mycena metata TaxID=1033252 RepID=A0AAD7JEM9_9AGAR|nr:hypothetical protein B0H16DRAFT_1455475 [Mycena metata]
MPSSLFHSIPLNRSDAVDSNGRRQRSRRSTGVCYHSVADVARKYEVSRLHSSKTTVEVVDNFGSAIASSPFRVDRCPFDTYRYMGRRSGAPPCLLSGQSEDCLLSNYRHIPDTWDDLFGPPRLGYPNLMDATQSPAAWTGIGSAMLYVWRQKTTAASLTGTFAVFLYLGNVLVLHISTPALFSLQTFNFTRPLQVETNGLPSYNFGNTSEEWSDEIVNLMERVPGSLYYLPSVLGSTGNLGLNEKWGVISGLVEFNVIDLVNRGAFNNITLYSTIPIIDSQNNHPPDVILSPPMNSTTIPVSRIQLFQCSQSLVNQTAVVDAQSRMLLSVEPGIYKKTSTWLPSNASTTQINSTTGNLFIDLMWQWGVWYYFNPPSAFTRDGDPNGANFVRVSDMYIIQKLNLHPAYINDTPSAVILHNLENTLGEIVAGMFWTRPSTTPPTFLRGNAIVTEIQTRVRLDIAAGLTASIVLALLSLPTLILKKTLQKDIPLDGTGMLHAIWLYRNNPELETELEQVEHPTDENLRQAGMVRINWAEEGLRRRKSCESF